jgi:hypothetical protein
MTSHIVVFLLVVCLLLSLTLLWRLCWLHLQPSYFKAGAVRTTVQRLLKPRTPLDCPFCRLACTPSLSVKPACALVRPSHAMRNELIISLNNTPSRFFRTLRCISDSIAARNSFQSASPEAVPNSRDVILTRAGTSSRHIGNASHDTGIPRTLHCFIGIVLEGMSEA